MDSSETALLPDDFSSIPDERIPHVLGPAALLEELTEQVRSAPKVLPISDTEALDRPFVEGRIPLVLVLGTGPCARAVLEMAALPLELRAEDATHDVWTLGFAHLSERLDAVLATRDWNATAAGRAAMLSANRVGTPVFFELADLATWLDNGGRLLVSRTARQWRGFREAFLQHVAVEGTDLAARRRDAIASDADERL